MKNDIKQLKRWIDAGIVRAGDGDGWGDGRTTAGLMTALTGQTSIEGCISDGWPRWLAELGMQIFDRAIHHWRERSIGFATAVQVAIDRKADLSFNGAVFRAFRLNSVLPIAIESLDGGDESWLLARQGQLAGALQEGGISHQLVERTGGGAGAAWAVWAVWASGEIGKSIKAQEAAWTRLYSGILAALEGDQ